MSNTISKSRGTLGVSTFVDGERCHICRTEPGARRINLDGIWTVLGDACVGELVSALASPSNQDPYAPEPRERKPYVDPHRAYEGEHITTVTPQTRGANFLVTCACGWRVNCTTTRVAFAEESAAGHLRDMARWKVDA